MTIEQNQILKIDQTMLRVHGGTGIAIEQPMCPRGPQRRKPRALVQPRQRLIDPEKRIEKGGIEGVFWNLVYG